jgi:hypothetical protein
LRSFRILKWMPVGACDSINIKQAIINKKDC